MNSVAPQLPGIKILVVDDDRPSVDLLIATLEGEGCVVVGAFSAAAALALLTPEPPRLVLLDLALPDMNGLELAKLIKAVPECRDTVIVAVSAMNGRDAREKAAEAGAVAYFRKPINTSSLAADLARLLKD